MVRRLQKNNNLMIYFYVSISHIIKYIFYSHIGALELWTRATVPRSRLLTGTLPSVMSVKDRLYHSVPIALC